MHAPRASSPDVVRTNANMNTDRHQRAGESASLDQAVSPLPLARRGHLNASASGLRQANRDHLLHGSRAMFAAANVLNLFANEFSGLCHWRFPFTPGLLCATECFRIRHVHGPLSRARVNRPTTSTATPEIAFEKVLHQDWNIFTPLAQWRQGDGKHDETEHRLCHWHQAMTGMLRGASIRSLRTIPQDGRKHAPTTRRTCFKVHVFSGSPAPRPSECSGRSQCARDEVNAIVDAPSVRASDDDGRRRRVYSQAQDQRRLAASEARQLLFLSS